MANSFYPYLAFIHDNSDANLESLHVKLLQFYEAHKIEHKPTISLRDQSLKISFLDGYSFYITFAKGDYVNEEAKEISNEQKLDWKEETYDSEKLKTCFKRFEIHGDPDFDMNYFNDSLFIIEIIDAFTEVFAFDVA